MEWCGQQAVYGSGARLVAYQVQYPAPFICRKSGCDCAKYDSLFFKVSFDIGKNKEVTWWMSVN